MSADVKTPANKPDPLDEIKRYVRTIARGVLAILVAIGIVTLGGWWDLNGKTSDIKHAQSAIQTSRLVNAKNGCLKDNAIRRAAGEAGLRKAQDFVKLQYEALGTTFEQQSPKIKELTLRFFAEQKQAALDSYPHRDCSTAAAINYFNQHQPHDPEPCVNPHHGLCGPDPPEGHP